MNQVARVLVHAIFLYTCIEGLVISVLYPSKLPFLYKDLAILVVYVLVFLPSPGRLLAPSPTVALLALPFLVLSASLGIYLVMPGTGLLAGLVALKQRLFYIPLISVGYLFVRTGDDLKRLFAALCVYVIGVSAFGVYLHFTGPEGLVEIGANYFGDLYTPWTGPGSETYWRVPGTFTSSGQYGAYLSFSGLVATALLLSESSSRRLRILAAVALGMSIVAILVSGTRTPFVMLTASVALLLVLARKPRRVVTIGLIAYVSLAYAFAFLGPGVKERFASIASYEHVERFQTTYFGQLFLPALLENPVGSGLGVATIGARHVSELGEVELVESYLAILVVETGLIGLVTFLWAAGTMGLLVLRLRQHVRSAPVSLLWHALAAYVLSTLLILPVSTAIDHTPSNLYFWFSIGALAKVADLERRRGLAELPEGPDVDRADRRRRQLVR